MAWSCGLQVWLLPASTGLTSFLLYSLKLHVTTQHDRSPVTEAAFVLAALQTAGLSIVYNLGTPDADLRLQWHCSLLAA